MGQWGGPEGREWGRCSGGEKLPERKRGRWSVCALERQGEWGDGWSSGDPERQPGTQALRGASADLGKAHLPISHVGRPRLRREDLAKGQTCLQVAACEVRVLARKDCLWTQSCKGSREEGLSTHFTDGIAEVQRAETLALGHTAHPGPSGKVWLWPSPDWTHEDGGHGGGRP